MAFAEFVAQAGATATSQTSQQQDPPFWANPRSSTFVMLILTVVVFYVFVFRSKQKQDSQRRGMLQQLKKGDRIQTIGGIIGNVVEVRDKEVVVKVDESANTKIRFARSAIATVLDEDNSSK